MSKGLQILIAGIVLLISTFALGIIIEPHIDAFGKIPSPTSLSLEFPVIVSTARLLAIFGIVIGGYLWLMAD